MKIELVIVFIFLEKYALEFQIHNSNGLKKYAPNLHSYIFDSPIKFQIENPATQISLFLKKYSWKLHAYSSDSQ